MGSDMATGKPEDRKVISTEYGDIILAANEDGELTIRQRDEDAPNDPMVVVPLRCTEAFLDALQTALRQGQRRDP